MPARHQPVDAVVDVLLVAVTAVAALILAATAPARMPTAAAGPARQAVEAAIDRLIVAEPSAPVAYDRAQFPHWIEITAGCDTRCAVLDRQRSPGGWLSAYDGYVATSATELEVDHVVPLAEAWVSGAAAWDLARRQAFANDLAGQELLAISSWTNRDKSASDPATWRPPNPAWWCRYAMAWTSVKVRWSLTADPAEVEALLAMARRC